MNFYLTAFIFSISFRKVYCNSRGLATLEVSPMRERRGLKTTYCTPSDIEERLMDKATDPYDKDRDYYMLNGGYPSSISCERSTKMCLYYVYELDDESSKDNAYETAYEPTLLEQLEQPCVRCEFRYNTWVSNTCESKYCGTYTCKPKNDVMVLEQHLDIEGKNASLAYNSESTENTASLSDSVEVCSEMTRVDLFAINEFRNFHSYGCSFSTAIKELGKEWIKGVTNVRKSMHIIGDAMSQEFQSEEDLTMDVCTYVVDDTECNSCSLCKLGGWHLDGFQVDCSNIVKGAVTSCDSMLSEAETIEAKLLVLQDGYTHPPRDPTTARPAKKKSKWYKSGGMIYQPVWMILLICSASTLFFFV